MAFKTLPKAPRIDFKYVDKTDGAKRQMVSVRLPRALLEALDRVSERTGKDRTWLVQYALDQLCQDQD